MVGAGVDAPAGGLSTRMGTMILGRCSEHPADATQSAMANERFTWPFPNDVNELERRGIA